MICKRCDLSMEIGKAIKYKGRSSEAERGIPLVAFLPITSDTLEMVDCWKCPKCGHSEDVQ